MNYFLQAPLACLHSKCGYPHKVRGHNPRRASPNRPFATLMQTYSTWVHPPQPPLFQFPYTELTWEAFQFPVAASKATEIEQWKA